MTKLLIFDLDGTLINTIADLAAACNYALQQTGHRIFPISSYPQMVGNGIYRLMARALRAQGIDAAEDGPEVKEMTPLFKSYYDCHNADNSAPYPGIVELLNQLQNDGYKLAVASNKYQAATDKIVRSFFPEIRWAAVLGQRDGVPHKPDPLVVSEVMETAGITDTAEVLYVGDSGVDLATAAAASVRFVAVTWGFVSEPDLLAAGAKNVARTADEIVQFL